MSRACELNVRNLTSPSSRSKALTKASLTDSAITLMAADQGLAGKIRKI
jgi:hypothetical protein